MGSIYVCHFFFPELQLINVFQRCFRAMYDYDACDLDEVSFKDGDVLINCSPVDAGWMTGTVQRSGLTGMLPANYVQPL